MEMVQLSFLTLGGLVLQQASFIKSKSPFSSSKQTILVVTMLKKRKLMEDSKIEGDSTPFLLGHDFLRYLLCFFE